MEEFLFSYEVVRRAYNAMVVQLRPRSITVDRGSRGFGLSLIYRGLDKYEEKDTGIFVARVVPGGQAARFGVKENDKIISINNKNPRNVDDAVGIIKDAGKSIKLMLLRQEEVPDVVVDDNLSLASTEMDSNWVSCVDLGSGTAVIIKGYKLMLTDVPYLQRN